MPGGRPTLTTAPRGRGRPSKLDQVVRTRDDGTPVTAGQQVIERAQLGMDTSAAADSAGIARSTLHQWRLAGARARAKEAQEGGHLTNAEVLLADFVDALERAEAEAEANRLAIIQRAATGGAQVKRVTRKVQRATAADGTVSEVEVERIEVTETLRPEWTAAAWWLERKRGYVKRYELTGAEGAPLVPPAEQARHLADSLRDYQQGIADAKATNASAAEAKKGAT